MTQTLKASQTTPLSPAWMLPSARVIAVTFLENKLLRLKTMAWPGSISWSSLQQANPKPVSLAPPIPPCCL